MNLLSFILMLSPQRKERKKKEKIKKKRKYFETNVVNPGERAFEMEPTLASILTTGTSSGEL